SPWGLEEADHRLLRDPLRVLREGGSLLSLARGDEVVGVCALLRYGADRIQLARMTVAEPNAARATANACSSPPSTAPGRWACPASTCSPTPRSARPCTCTASTASAPGTKARTRTTHAATW